MAVAPNGRRLLRIEARNAQTPIEAKPRWIRTTATMGPEFRDMKKRVKGAGLHTVCQEAGCPNIHECWEDREATFPLVAIPVPAVATSATLNLAVPSH